MSAGDPNTNPHTPTDPENAPENTDAATSGDEAVREEAGVEEKKKKGILGKALAFMPAWAWILCFGLVLALIVAIGAVISMNSTEVGNESPGGKPSQVTPSYPKATTSGTWATGSTPASEEYYYDPGYQPEYNYVPPQQDYTEETPSEESSTPEEPHSEEDRPVPRPRPSEPAPRPEQPRPTQPGNGGGNPGGGNGGNQPGNPVNPGNPGNPGGGNGGDAPIEEPVEPTN